MKNILVSLPIIAGVLMFSPIKSMGTEQQHAELLQSIIDGTVTYEQINEFKPARCLLSGLLTIATHTQNTVAIDPLLQWIEQWLQNRSYGPEEIKSFKEQELHEALETAAWLGNIAAIEKLLLFGASVHTRNNEALMRAIVGNGNANSGAVVILLLQHGANGFARQGAFLRQAVTTHKQEIVEILLQWAAQHSQDQIFSADLIDALLEYTNRNYLQAIHDSLQEYRRVSSPRRRISC